MARRRNRSWPDHRASHRTARVGELIRRIVAENLEGLDDDRLDMVSVTGVDVDRDLHRAVVWFTTLDGDDDEDVSAAFAENASKLRWQVGKEARLRKTPELMFRPDAVLRTAERIEKLFARVESSVGSSAGLSVGSADKSSVGLPVGSADKSSVGLADKSSDKD